MGRRVLAVSLAFCMAVQCAVPSAASDVSFEEASSITPEAGMEGQADVLSGETEAIDMEETVQEDSVTGDVTGEILEEDSQDSVLDEEEGVETEIPSIPGTDGTADPVEFSEGNTDEGDFAIEGIEEVPGIDHVSEEGKAELPAAGASTEQAGGSCGTSLRWSLSTTGTLTISGAGAMTEYEYVGETDDERTGEDGSDFPWEKYKDSIKRVVVEDGVTSLAPGAFWACYELTDVTVGNDVASIGYECFYDCAALENVTLGEGLQTIEESAFDDCVSLTAIAIPDQVTSIGDYAFDNCMELAELTIGKSVQTIGESAFVACGGLKRIVLPATLTNIGANAFDSCDSLTEIHFQGKCPTIGEDVFLYDELKAYYPADDKTWATIAKEQPAYGAEKIEWLPENGIVWDLTGGVLTISAWPETVEEFKSAADSPWYDRQDEIRSVVVEETGKVEKIGDYAFSGCAALTDIRIPESVKTIGSSAFRNCHSLIAACFFGGKNSVSFGDSPFDGSASSFKVYYLQEKENEGWSRPSCTLGQKEYQTGLWGGTVGTGATWRFWFDTQELTFTGAGDLPDWETPEKIPWSDCTDFIEKISIVDGITSIGANSFCNSPVAEVHLPNDLRRIGDEAFKSCAALGTDDSGKTIGLTIPAGVTEIGASAFEGDSSLQKITFQSGTGGESAECQIGEKAFMDCTMLAELTLPDGLTRIGDYAFAYCNGQKGVDASLTIPSGVAYVGNFAFAGCDFLDTVTFLDADDAGSAVEKTLGESAFYACSMLARVSLPKNLKTIGAHAFDSCINLGNTGEPEDVYTLVIPADVQTVGESAFEDCSSLEKVYFEGLPAETDSEDEAAFRIDDRAFRNCTHLYNARFDRNAPELGCYVFEGCKQAIAQAPTIEERIGFVITFTAGKKNWKVPYVVEHPSTGEEACKYKSESTSFSVWRDTWKFSNAAGDFTRSTELGHYYLRQEDHDRLVRNLSNVDRGVIEDEINEEWNGSCSGMSSVIYLLNSKNLNLADLGITANELISSDNTERVESAINFYQLQASTECRASKWPCNVFHAHSQQKQLQILTEQIKKAMDGDSLVFIGYDKKIYNSAGEATGESSAHAVIGYFYEEGNWKYRGHNFDKRIIIFDPSYHDMSTWEDYCLYYNDSCWCIPGYDIISESYRATSPQDNAFLQLVTSDTDWINFIDYNSGALSPVASASELRITLWDCDSGNGAYEFTVTYDQDGTEHIVEIGPTGVREEGNPVDDIVVVHPSNSAQGGSGRTGYIFPEGADNLSIRSENPSADFSLAYEHYYEKVKMSAPGKISFGPDGSISVAMDDKAAYSVQVTADEDYYTLPWHTYSVSGDQASELSAKLTDDGIEISGDNLEAHSVSVNNYEERQNLNVSSDQDTVLVSTDGQSNSAAAYEDSDGNGTYDRRIAAAHTYGEPTFTWTVDHSAATATFSCIDPDCGFVQTVDCVVTSETNPAACAKSGSVTYTATATFGEKTYTATADVTLKALGHSYVSWKTVSGSAEQLTEVQRSSCTRCGVTKTRSMTVSATSFPLKTKQTTNKLKVSGLAAGDYVKSWQSSNTRVATVSQSGKITAKKKMGKAVITITLASGLNKKITVKVQKKKVTTKKIKGIPKARTLRKGDSFRLTPELQPITTTQKITYSSSNKKVATVDKKGRVKAKKKGKATITVKSGKKKVKCKVTVR